MRKIILLLTIVSCLFSEAIKQITCSSNQGYNGLTLVFASYSNCNREVYAYLGEGSTDGYTIHQSTCSQAPTIKYNDKLITNYETVSDMYSKCCATGYHWNNGARRCDKDPCGANQTYDENEKKCICNPGYASNDNNENCSCYVGNSTVSYSAASSKQECEALEVVRIDSLNAYYKFTWNDCISACIAQQKPPCDLGEVYNQDGDCVPATLDPQSCIAAGGSVKNIRITTADACISSTGDIIAPCCQKVADCVVDSNPPRVLQTISEYVMCGSDVNVSDIPKCATCKDPTPIATDTGVCTNSDQTEYNSCPNPDNKCPNCPSNYPIADDYGDCKNSNGDTTICPIYLDNNYTAPYMCTTCSQLGQEWHAKDDKCTRTTDAGIVQIVSCPQTNTNDTNNTTHPTTQTKSDTNITNSVNTRPNSNSNFTDSNTTDASGKNITPSLGDNSGTQYDQNNTKTEKICKKCPHGYVNSNGLCVLISSNGTIVSTARCPKGGTKTVDTNKSDPLDENGTDGNMTGTMNELGQRGVDEIKKAYKEYSIFPTDCGQLVPMKPITMFNGKLYIQDPLIKFNDVMMPYRDLIKNFLIFIVVIIGLFDFFRRS